MCSVLGFVRTQLLDELFAVLGRDQHVKSGQAHDTDAVWEVQRELDCAYSGATVFGIHSLQGGYVAVRDSPAAEKKQQDIKQIKGAVEELEQTERQPRQFLPRSLRSGEAWWKKKKTVWRWTPSRYSPRWSTREASSRSRAVREFNTASYLRSNIRDNAHDDLNGQDTEGNAKWKVHPLQQQRAVMMSTTMNADSWYWINGSLSNVRAILGDLLWRRWIRQAGALVVELRLAFNLRAV
jgi:hypothetical protein